MIIKKCYSITLGHFLMDMRTDTLYTHGNQ